MGMRIRNYLIGLLFLSGISLFLIFPVYATSIWEDSPQSRNRYGDNVAIAEGDLVKITISEDAIARTNSSSDREKSMEIGGQAGTGADNSTFFNDVASWLPFFGASVSGGSSSDARRGTDMSGSFNAQMSVEVIESRGNGTLVLEGTREIKIDDEIKTLTFNGLARQRDVRPDNTIPSDRIANATISYEGELGLQTGEPQGLLGRSWAWVKNFLFW